MLTSYLVPLQFAVLLLGYIFSAGYGYILSRQTFSTEASARRGFVPLLVFLTALTLGFGLLYGG